MTSNLLYVVASFVDIETDISEQSHPEQLPTCCDSNIYSLRKSNPRHAMQIISYTHVNLSILNQKNISVVWVWSCVTNYALSSIFVVKTQKMDLCSVTEAA